MSLDLLELKNNSEKCNKLVFILHGYGADGNDLISLASHWQRFLPDYYFCAPNAPNVCQVSAMGFEWFDLMQSDLNQIKEETLISLDKLSESIKEKLEILNLTNKDLILVGFSQGTMMSIQYAASQKEPISGVLGYSGRIYDEQLFLEKLNSKTKIKLLHGNSDEIVPVEEMYKTVDFLKKQKFDIDYNVYEGLGHSISPEGLSEGLVFLQNLNS